MNILNPSMVTLPRILELRNTNGKYDHIIQKAKKGGYHDYKFDLVYPETEALCPKMELIDELSQFPELEDIIDMVVSGDFDDRPDEEDKERLRKDLRENGSEGLQDLLGL
ncbi:MAG: hypothetical protein ACK40G_13825 [Cytophagaceae bacterium]